jgi:hypothetical protein
VGLYKLSPHPDLNAPVIKGEVPPFPTPLQISNLKPLDVDKIVKDLEKSQASVLKEMNVTDTIKSIETRPEFISPLEWQVLHWLAQQKPDSHTTLTRLANNIRFTKQESLYWELKISPEHRSQCEDLARQLLDNIPARVSANQLSKFQAHKLQNELIRYLHEDKKTLRSKLASASESIGVRFEIE